MLAARQIRVYCQCAEATRLLEGNSIKPFAAPNGDSAILLVRATQRSKFFFPMAMYDSLDEPQIKEGDHRSGLTRYGHTAMEYEMEGVHTVCCGAVRCGRQQTRAHASNTRHVS